MENWKKKKEEKKETLQCELRDLMEMIRRFTAANNDKVCFVGNFVAFETKGKNKGDFLDAKDGCNIMIAYGQLETIRTMLNDLRDAAEDEADEDGEVSF
jgi:hypothetical protein